LITLPLPALVFGILILREKKLVAIAAGMREKLSSFSFPSLLPKKKKS